MKLDPATVDYLREKATELSRQAKALNDAADILESSAGMPSKILEPAKASVNALTLGMIREFVGDGSSRSDYIAKHFSVDKDAVKKFLASAASRGELIMDQRGWVKFLPTSEPRKEGNAA